MELAQLGKYLSKVKNIYTLLALSIVIVGAIIHLAVPIGDLRVIKVTVIIGLNLILMLLLPKIMKLIPKSQRTFVFISLVALFYISVASASVYVLGKMYESYAEEMKVQVDVTVPSSTEAETPYEKKEKKNSRTTFTGKTQQEKSERPEVNELVSITSEMNQLLYSAALDSIESSKHIGAFYPYGKKGITTFENTTNQPVCGIKVPRTITFYEEEIRFYPNQFIFSKVMGTSLVTFGLIQHHIVCSIDFEMDITHHEGRFYTVKENTNLNLRKSTKGYTFKLNKQNYKKESDLYTLAFCDQNFDNCTLRNYRIDVWEDSEDSSLNFKYEQVNNLYDLFDNEQIIGSKAFWLVSKNFQNLGFVYFKGTNEMHLYIDERYNRTLFVKNETKHDAALTIWSVLSCENGSYWDALKDIRSIEPLTWC